ncbi:MAG: hypothetical protein IJX62_07980, partial [Clostridia bacterium]|nr:hypothetical protein [Clostridia bacterium]
EYRKQVGTQGPTCFYLKTRKYPFTVMHKKQNAKQKALQKTFHRKVFEGVLGGTFFKKFPLKNAFPKNRIPKNCVF